VEVATFVFQSPDELIELGRHVKTCDRGRALKRANACDQHLEVMQATQSLLDAAQRPQMPRHRCRGFRDRHPSRRPPDAAEILAQFQGIPTLLDRNPYSMQTLGHVQTRGITDRGTQLRRPPPAPQVGVDQLRSGRLPR
jgi:hypothetical protein